MVTAGVGFLGFGNMTGLLRTRVMENKVDTQLYNMPIRPAPVPASGKYSPRTYKKYDPDRSISFFIHCIVHLHSDYT